MCGGERGEERRGERLPNADIDPSTTTLPFSFKKTLPTPPQSRKKENNAPSSCKQTNSERYHARISKCNLHHLKIEVSEALRSYQFLSPNNQEALSRTKQLQPRKQRAVPCAPGKLPSILFEIQKEALDRNVDGSDIIPHSRHIIARDDILQDGVGLLRAVRVSGDARI